MHDAITEPRSSSIHSLLSLIVPGLGQFVAGARSRALSILFSFLGLGALSIWTAAQEARFPDFGLSFGVFWRLFLQSGALLIFLIAVRYLLTRYVIHDNAVAAFLPAIVGLVYVMATFLLTWIFLGLAGSAETLGQVHGPTAVYSAAALAAFWLWQAADAGRIAGNPNRKKLPDMTPAILILCVLIFFLGLTITGVDISKVIREYKDASILLPRIVWPWEQAFEYDQDVVETAQQIQSPCPEGAVGPPSNDPDPDAAWISATPTCGDLGERFLTGGFEPGTELTITGGNFTPGETIDILWKNPIGNPFTPRGVGETEIEIGPDGTFVTTLSIPDVVVPESTSVGAQIHTLLARESSEEVFSGRLSGEMKLALVGILETIMIGLMATFFGIILAFPLSFLAARNIMRPITSTLNQISGSLLGAVLGIAVSLPIIQLAANLLGGLERNPILVFSIAMILVMVLGFFGYQLVGRLFARLLASMGEQLGRIISSLFLAAAAAVPGYLIGLGFSRGVRSIVLNAEIAAQNEVTYAYIGAAITALLALILTLRIDPKRELSVGLGVYTIVRMLMNIVRSIEPLIWGIVFVIWVGLGAFAGTLALTLHTIAALGKLFSESVESIDAGPLEALQATGANRLQTVIYAVIPQILPPFISFTIYRWDINVRMSTIIGLVGGGGIGFILIQWMRLYQWEAAGIAIWLITITVATLDFVSSNIRERFI